MPREGDIRAPGRRPCRAIAEHARAARPRRRLIFSKPVARRASDSCRRTPHSSSRSASLVAHRSPVAPVSRHTASTSRISSSTAACTPSHSTITIALQPAGTTARPKCVSTARSEGPSMSSSAAGTTRRAMTPVTASTAWRTSENAADNVVRTGGFGIRRSVTLVMIASVPSEPTSNWVKS